MQRKLSQACRFSVRTSLSKPEDDGSGERDGGQEEVAATCVAHGDASPIFQAGKGVPDAAALLVELAVVGGGALSLAAGRDADPDTVGLQFVPQPVGVIALVAQQALCRWKFGQPHQSAFGVARLARREEEVRRCVGW